ncbi:MAG: hypothetical protein JRJ31_22825, partial [Deltaproteobacteria bacterium]|nr:hypothetical protein [Deltaproteobacteria bacterium]
MGEIKSTLEIIMEKTKGLTVSEEEKAAYKEQEASRKIKSLAQKYVDGAVKLEALKIEVAALEKESPDLARKLLLDEVIPKIELEGDNESTFEILEQVLGLDTGPMRKALEEAGARLDSERVSLERSILERLKEKGVSGAAVIPNINADSEW